MKFTKEDIDKYTTPDEKELLEEKYDPTDLPRGRERADTYYDRTKHEWMTQYYFRHPDGELFSCLRETFDDCLKERDEWFSKKLEAKNKK